MNRIASLDLGSNTFLLLVADFEGAKLKEVVREELRVTRLGQGVHENRAFHKEALHRAEECFKEYSEILSYLKPDKLVAMATSAARDVKNGEELFRLGEKYGIKIQVIPGAKEAQISFEGSTFEWPDARGLAVVDVGGGSTEIVGLNEQSELKGHSLNIGSVRLTEMFVETHPVSESNIRSMEKYCFEQIEAHRNSMPEKGLKDLVAVAGTPTTLAAVIQSVTYSAEKVHGYRINLEELEKWRDDLAKMDLESRKKLIGMDPRRADVIVAGTTILLCVAKALGQQSLFVSDKGVRYGIAHMAARGEC